MGKGPFCNFYPTPEQLKLQLTSEFHELAPNTEMLQILFNTRTMRGHKVDTI